VPAVRVFQTPWESAKAIVQDHVLAKYGIAEADPLTVVADMVFGPMEHSITEDGEVVWIGTTPELRLSAAKELLKHTRPQVRAVHVQLDGQIDVNHNDKTALAKEKAERLLAALGAKKYAQVAVEEGQIIEEKPGPGSTTPE
jgi:hypothetical protein